MFTRKRASFVFIAFALLASLAGCGGGGGGETSSDVSVNAIDGAAGVPVDKNFTYTFSNTVQKNTVTADTFFILETPSEASAITKADVDPAICDPENALEAAVSCATEVACTLDPAENLAPATSYTICLNTDIAYFGGAPFEGFMATFTTAPKPENVRVIPGATATQLVASWDELSGATSYNIYWGTSPGVTTATGTKIEGAANPYTQDDLTTGTPYYYIVTGVFPLGEGPASVEVIGVPQIDPVGVLDETFNGTGYVQFAAIPTFWAGGVKIDSQGRIVVAGSTLDPVTGYDMAVWRYNADGTPDTTFGGGTGYITVHGTAGGNHWDKGFDVAIDSSGRLVVAGESEDATLNNDAIVWRLNEDGTADTTFGTGGVVIYDRGIGGNNSASGVAIDSNGNIVATGYTGGPANDDMIVWRYTPDGVPDATFGTDGVVIYDSTPTKPDSGFDVAIDSDGNIVIVGTTKDAADSDRLAVWRYKPDGTLDTTFGGSGVVLYDGGDSNQGFGAAIDPDDRVLATGDYISGVTPADAVVARFQNDGALDTTFSEDGAAFYATGVTDGAAAVGVDSRGRVLITGISNLSFTTSAMFLARFTEAGEIDTTFGTEGAVTYHDVSIANSEDNGSAITFDSTGRIVVAGTTYPYGNQRLIIWRYR